MRFAKYGEYAPLVLVIAGFVLIAIGWNGAAGLDYTQGQIPYVISGGLSGLGLIFFGCTAMLLRAIRRGLAAQEQQTQELLETMQRTASTLTLAANGHNGSSSSTTTTVELVVAGSSSFHLPNCRLVGQRESMVQIPREEALESGLQPCRICKP